MEAEDSEIAFWLSDSISRHCYSGIQGDGGNWVQYGDAEPNRLCQSNSKRPRRGYDEMPVDADSVVCKTHCCGVTKSEFAAQLLELQGAHSLTEQCIEDIIAMCEASIPEFEFDFPPR